MGGMRVRKIGLIGLCKDTLTLLKLDFVLSDHYIVNYTIVYDYWHSNLL